MSTGTTTSIRSKPGDCIRPTQIAQIIIAQNTISPARAKDRASTALFPNHVEISLSYVTHGPNHGMNPGHLCPGLRTGQKASSTAHRTPGTITSASCTPPAGLAHLNQFGFGIDAACRLVRRCSDLSGETSKQGLSTDCPRCFK